MQSKETIDLNAIHPSNEITYNLKVSLHILSQWLVKNVGSAEHTKALKM